MEPNYILQPNRVSVDGSPAPQSYFIFGIFLSDGQVRYMHTI